jgi:ankyrin repeat protein
LEKEANPNTKDTLRNTPLHLAACTNNVAFVTLLLKPGVLELHRTYACSVRAQSTYSNITTCNWIVQFQSTQSAVFINGSCQRDKQKACNFFPHLFGSIEFNRLPPDMA